MEFAPSNAQNRVFLEMASRHWPFFATNVAKNGRVVGHLEKQPDFEAFVGSNPIGGTSVVRPGSDRSIF